MRILTVRQPYAGLIAAGVKPVENRTRNVAGQYRGPVAIHSAKIPANTPWDPNPWTALYDSVGLATKHDALGVILCVVDLVDVHADDCWTESLLRLAKTYVDNPAELAELPDNGAGGLVGRARRCSPWAEEDCHHLVLANPRLLPEPIPYKGALGLRELPAEVEALIWAQIGGQ